MNQHPSQFPNHQSELNYAFSDEPILLNGMKVIFDQSASVYPVNLQLKNGKTLNTSLAKSLSDNRRFSGALNVKKFKHIKNLTIHQDQYLYLNDDYRLTIISDQPWELDQAYEGNCGFSAVIMAKLYFAGNQKGRQKEITKIINAIYHNAKYEEMLVTEKVYLLEGQLMVKNGTILDRYKTQDNIIRVEFKNKLVEVIKKKGLIANKDGLVSTIKIEKKLPLPIAGINSIEIETTEGAIDIPVDQDGSFKVEAQKGFVKRQLEKQLSRYQYSDEESLRTYSPKRIDDYILIAGIIIFFKEHLTKDLASEDAKLWDDILKFDDIFRESNERARLKKVEDMQGKERVYKGHEKGDLALTKEGLYKLGHLMNVSEEYDDAKHQKYSFAAPAQYESDSKEYKVFSSILMHKNLRIPKNHFVFKWNEKLLENITYPCILGVTTGSMFFDKIEEDIIKGIKEKTEKETNQKRQEFKKYNYLTHWIFMPDENEIWSWGEKYELQRDSPKNLKKSEPKLNGLNISQDKIMSLNEIKEEKSKRGEYYIPVECVPVRNFSMNRKQSSSTDSTGF
ncbi:MAG: hypothetical protein AAFQ80_16215 [Cyanobacteria bacterium J06621_8]